MVGGPLVMRNLANTYGNLESVFVPLVLALTFGFVFIL